MKPSVKARFFFCIGRTEKFRQLRTIAFGQSQELLCRRNQQVLRNVYEKVEKTIME